VPETIDTSRRHSKCSQNGGKVDKHHIFSTRLHKKGTQIKPQETTKGKAISIATPDEIVRKGLEISGFDRQWQQMVKRETCLRLF
jgi:hypothetical protein